MIFEHLFCDNFCYNFLSYSHYFFTLSLYSFDFRAIPIFSLQIMVVLIRSQLKVVQITLLIDYSTCTAKIVPSVCLV